MSDKRRTRTVAIALAVTLVASVLAGGAIVAAQTDGNETDGNETDGLNETQAENETNGLNETETETDAGLNETENETDAGLNETENETDAGLNETEVDASDDETEADNETAAANETAADDEEIGTQQTSHLRVVQGSPEVDAVDVTIDNETVASDVGYGNVTDYQTVEAGESNVTITTTEDDEVVYQENVTIEPRSALTFAAASGEIRNESDEEEFTEDDATPDLETATFDDNAFEPDDGEAAVSVVHLSPDAGNVDVTLEDNDTVLADNLSYQNASDYVTLAEGDYTVEVRMEGDNEGSNILETFDVTVEGGTAYSAIALGFDMPPEPDSQRTLELTTTEDATTSITLPTDGDEAAETDTEDETEEEMNETEDEDAAMNETANETEGLNETEDDAEGSNETVGDENETVGDENETLGEDEDNETLADENETGAEEANESENETALLAP